MKVARWVLRGTTLGNRCRLLDTFELESAMGKNSAYEGFGHKVSAVTLSYRFAKWALNSGSKKVRNH